MIKKNNENQQPGTAACDTRRRYVKSVLGGGALALPLVWGKPLVNSIMMPAHAQLSPRQFAVSDSLHQVAQFFTESRLPTGELTPVDSISRVRFRGCQLPANASIMLSAFIQRSAGADLALLNTAFSASAGGSYTVTANVGTQPVFPVAEIVGIRVDMLIDGEAFNYTLSQTDVTAASNGSTPALTC